MPERVTRVRFVAEASNYIANVEQMAQKTRALGSASEKLAAQRQGYDTLGRSAIAFGAVAAAGVALAVARFAEFDAAMSNVQAATHETTGNMELLRNAALEAGASTVYTATEAAGAIEELSKAGVETADILGGALTGALNLAAAGEMDVAAAAEIAATAMVIFKRDGSEVPHIADLLAAAAGKAQGSVTDMSFALKQSALVAAQMGLSVEDTTSGLALFAANGLLGSDAGTSFRTMLLALNPKSKEAAETMNDLGFSAYDQQGNFIGLAGVADELHKSLDGMSTAQRTNTLQIVFGQDAIRAATVLYQAGSEGVNEWTEKVNDSGYAAQTAAIRLDNLKGDIEKLGGSFDTALIKSGSGANDTLRTLTQNATFLVDALGSAPKPAMDAGLAIGTAVAAIGLTGGTALTAIPKIADFKAGLDALNVSGKGAALGIGLVGGAVSVAVFAIGALITAQAEAKAKADEYAGSLDELTLSTTNYSREIAQANLSEKGGFLWLETGADSAYDAAEKIGLSLDTVTDAALGNADALSEVQTKLEDIQAMSSSEKTDAFGMGNGLLAEASAQRVADAVKGEADSIAEAVRVSKQKQEADRDSVPAADAHADALANLSGAASDANDEIDDLANAISNFGQTQLEAEAAQRAMEAAIDDASAAIKENGATLDIGTAKGRANRDALADIVDATNKRAAAAIADGASQAEVNKILERGRDKYVEIAEKAGEAKDKARDYARTVIATPEQVSTAFEITGIKTAKNEMDEFYRLYNGRIITQSVKTNGTSRTPGFASGGMLPGAPSSTDNMLIHAASGEFIVNAQDAQRHRALLEQINSGGIPGYATGGMVATRYVSNPTMQAPQPPVIYVQNQFTGEYVRAEIAGVAQGVVNRSNADAALDINAGGLAV